MKLSSVLLVVAFVVLGVSALGCSDEDNPCDDPNSSELMCSNWCVSWEGTGHAHGDCNEDGECECSAVPMCYTMCDWPDTVATDPDCCERECLNLGHYGGMCYDANSTCDCL